MSAAVCPEPESGTSLHDDVPFVRPHFCTSQYNQKVKEEGCPRLPPAPCRSSRYTEDSGSEEYAMHCWLLVGSSGSLRTRCHAGSEIRTASTRKAKAQSDRSARVVNTCPRSLESKQPTIRNGSNLYWFQRAAAPL